MAAHRVPLNWCRSCGYQLDGAGSLPGDDPRRPEEGDLSVCGRCGYLAFYTAELLLRPLTLLERAHVLLDPEVRRVQQVILQGRHLADLD
jgi:hypothetical protein